MDMICKKIINYIKRNRVSTTEVADCMNKSGALKDIKAVNQGQFVVGRIKYIYAHSESNWSVHEQARDVSENDLVVIDGIDLKDRAIIGELVTKFLILYKGAVGIVILGNARDANDLIKEKYPVWCKGFNPIGCFNVYKEETEEVLEVVNKNKELYDGSICVCDDTGVVVITKNLHTEDFYNKLDNIEKQEDIWFDCIDRRKWDTYETVCLKKYLES